MDNIHDFGKKLTILVKPTGLVTIFYKKGYIERICMPCGGKIGTDRGLFIENKVYITGLNSSNVFPDSS